MIKILLLDKIYTIARCFEDRFVGQMGAPDSWKVVKLVFLRKPDAEPKKVITSYSAIALTSVMSKWYASCVMMRTEQEKVPETWNRLHMEGVSNTSRHHLQCWSHISHKNTGNGKKKALEC